MKQKVLEMLKNSDDYISGQEICDRLGVSRTAVWKAVNALRSQGYVIDSSTNRGYKLSGITDIISADAVKAALCTEYIGKDIYVLDTVDSTNNFAKNLGQNGAKSGIVVFAREQTGGKGRLGRVWSAERDSGIFMSVLLRPNISPAEVSAVTPLTGLAVYRVIGRLCRDAAIKWPNDIIIGHKKVCGILTEMSAEADRVNYLVIGIGVNVDAGSFPKEIGERAVSLSQVCKKQIAKSELASQILNELEAILSENEFTLKEAALAEYKSACASLNREIGFERRGERLKGRALDINQSGALVVKDENGELFTLSSGEVTVSGIY